jgi:hypothetical protein
MGVANEGSNGAVNAVGVLYSDRDTRLMPLQEAIRGKCSRDIFFDRGRDGTLEHELRERGNVESQKPRAEQPLKISPEREYVRKSSTQ